MSIKINFDAHNNILFVASIIVEDKKESIAIDGIRVLFQSLKETTERIEKWLIDISSNTIYLDPSKSECLTGYSSLIGEIWILIDGIHRMGLVLNHIQHIKTRTPSNIMELFKDITSIRNSFHHINERIDSHFEKLGGSVFGDIFWNYREKADSPDILHFLITGISKVSRNLKIEPKVTTVNNTANIGIHKLGLIYIKKEKKSHNKVVIYLDDIILYINNLIIILEYHYSNYLVNSDKTKRIVEFGDHIYGTKELVCDPPRIFRFKTDSKLKSVNYSD